MSESFVRKVQPFTIGTRLSVSGPATRSKGPNFPQQPSWQSDRVSLYLSQVQVSVATPHLAPLANRTTPTSGPVKQQQEDISTQDHRNQNAMSHRSSVSPTATSRSIRKITISGSPEKEDSSWRRQEESDHRVVIEKEDSSWRRQEESDHRVVIEKEDSSWRRQEESDHRVVIEKEDSSWRRQEESDHRVVIEKEDSSWRRQEESDHRVVSIGPEPGRHPVTGTPGSENIIINNINNNNSSKLPRIVGVSCENKPSSHFKQGRGLIRAQHPGNSKIQDFLIRLEELWEELRRRHHRNQVYLQAGEEMSFRTVQLLQALGSIEAWLEAAELSMSNSQLAGDTETMRLAERDSCLLQTEMSCRGMELTALRQEMDRLGGQREGQCPGYPNTEGLQVPQHHTQVLPDLMDQVERKYQRVQNTLTQQSSSLQDTRMLTEFLETVELEERVELEETQEARGWGYSSNLGQPLHSEISSALTLLGDGGGSDGGEPLKEPLGNPVEELREAVEMLNDTVRERGRSQNHIHDQAIQTMIRQLAVLSVRVEDSLCCSRELNLDLLQREKDMAMRCEPERCGLEGLEEQQDHLEVNYAVLKEEVEELQRQTDYLEELCPERVTFLGVEVQGALGVWRELRRNVEENRDRLRQFVHLQDFFRTYLAMISWMEDTRECIFSERVLHCGRDDQEPMAVEMEMDVQIDRKLEELEELDAAGRNLLNAEHHLANMIHERLEELRSMLGWILVHWRDQKHQRSQRRNNETEPNEDSIYSEPPTEQITGDIIYAEPPTEQITGDSIYTNTESTTENYSETAEQITEDNIYTNTVPESTRDNIYSETTVESTRDNIYSETTVESTRDNIYSETTVESTRDNIYSETTVESTRDNIYSETTVASTRDNIYSETTVESTRDNIYSETTVESTRDNIYSETTVESTRDNIYSESTAAVIYTDATACPIHSTPCQPVTHFTPALSVFEDRLRTIDSRYCPSTDQQSWEDQEDGYQVMNSNTRPPRCSGLTSPPETHQSPCLVLKEPSSPALCLGGTMSQLGPSVNSSPGVSLGGQGVSLGGTSVNSSSRVSLVGQGVSLGGTSVNSSPRVSLVGQGVSLGGQGVSLGHQGGMVCLGDTVKNSPTLSLGGSVDLGVTVNLILSLGNQGDSHVQVMEANPGVGEEEKSTEPVHRPPKTFWRCCQGLWENTLGSLKRKIYRQSAEQDNNMTSAYESILLPRLHTKTSSSSSPSSSSSSSSSSSGPPHPCVSFSSSLPKNTSIFSSLKRRSKKKRRRKRDAGRHTIQKIMVVEGEEQIEVACPAEAAPQPITLYDTQTWPMKEGRRKKKSLLKAEGVGPGQGVELVDYMDNPLARDIEDECSGVYTVSPYAVTEAVSIAPPRGQVRSHCRFLSLGSVLTFDLSKDMRLIPSIQDVITIGLPEHRGTPNPNLNPNPHTETHAALSSFKHTRSSPSDTHRAPDNEAVTTDRYETMTQIQTQPLLTQTHPLMTQIQTQPLLTQTHPLMTQIQTQPLLTQIQTQPLLTQIQTQPLLTQIQAHPLLTQIQTQPPLTQIQTRPLPTQIQTQPLMTQIQTQPPLTQIQTRPLPTQIQTQPPLTQIQTRPILTQIQTRPLMTQIQTRPILTQIQTQPLPTQIQTQPPLTQIQTRPLPTQIQTRPLPTQIQTQTQTQTRPLPTQIQTRPLPTQIQTQPLPTQIQTQPLQTQIQTQILKQTKPQTQAIQMEPLSNLDTDFPPPPALDEDWDQNVPSDDLSLSQIQTVHQEPEQEWSEFVSSKQPPITAYCPKSPVPMNRDHYNYMERAMVSRSPIVKSKDSSPSSAYQNHESLIQDLNRHQYHHRLKTHRASVDLQETCQASQMVVDLKISGLGSMMEDSMDSGISGVSNSGSLKLNAPDVPQEPRPRRTVLGRLVSLEVGRMEAVSRPRENPAATTAPAHPETKTTPRNRHPDHQTETELDSDPVHPDLIVHPDHQTETELNSDPVHPDLIVHPDHQQFEELEEELEDIWNHSNGYRQSISSDIMYQPHQEEGGSSNPPGLTTDPLSPPQDQPQAPPYRKLITASAPNLIVAEFTLPSSLQTLLGYNQDQGFSQDPNSREELPILANRDRRSWAAFPVQDQPWRTTALVNETAEDPVKLPEIEDQKRYIYQYREEEEEEVEEDEEEKMEDTGGPKDPSMSLLSVHMGLDRSNQRADCCVTLEGVMEKQGESLATGGRCGAMVRDQEQQGQKLATGGRCGTMVRDQEQQGQKLATGGRCGTMNGSELQTMEGTLERKHTLQLGGKKARSRAWSSHHAVLYKQTLCFYQDSKDTLRNCVCGLSLTLTGAECVSAPENTKKPQCFSLRLRDGSEYLLNTATRFMMKKWMLTIQANTVASEHVSSMASPSDHLVQDPPASFLSRSTHTGKARAKEIVVLTRETPRQIPQWHPEKQQDPTSSSHTDRREDNYDSLRHKLCGSSRENSPSSLHSSIPPFSLHSSVSPPFSSVSPPFSSVSPPFSSVYRGGQDWLSQVNKCHSFTSARYQKIKAALLPPGGRGRDYGSVGQDCVSNYSVTMIIGDKQCAASPTLSCDGSGPSITSHTDPQRPLLDGWQLHSYHQDSLTRRQRHQHQAMYHQDQEPSLRGCTSLPPPRNKSVFNKFFGKKD
ncbi:uncharacterized protein [Salvelinus alpinus]|uniref:uncharacterized protein isoform X3 n=1 Tax=Salvelinus alpinus TaxID=8036 RepID=UPI0039FC984D